jgi:hypothetical protein
LYYFKLLEDLVVGLESPINFTFTDDFDRNFNFGILVLRKHNEAEGALSKWSNRLILVNVTLRIEALGLEDLVVPVLLGLLGLEVDGPLLLG